MICVGVWLLSAEVMPTDPHPTSGVLEPPGVKPTRLPSLLTQLIDLFTTQTGLPAGAQR